MSTPFSQAVMVYEQEPCARSFQEDLWLHFVNGFVFATPEFFIMGRPVIKGATEADVVNPRVRFPSSECDCWHIALMAGNCVRAWSILPWPLEWLSWERRNELRYHRFGAVRTHTPP